MSEAPKRYIKDVMWTRATSITPGSQVYFGMASAVCLDSHDVEVIIVAKNAEALDKFMSAINETPDHKKFHPVVVASQRAVQTEDDDL